MAKIRHLRIGSLLCRIESDYACYGEILSDIYGTDLLGADVRDTEPIGLSLRIEEHPEAERSDSDALFVNRVEGGFLLDSDPIACRLSTGLDTPHVEITVKQPSMNRVHLSYHFWIVTNRLLLLLDRILLHAATIDFLDDVNLFIGRKGAGKSTLSMILGQAGGTILAEDHAILRQDGAGFLVSGCTSRMRLTADTERLLEHPLDCVPVDVGGTPKKEFPAERFFAACPYEDRRPGRLFLTRVGEKLSVRPVPASTALLWMMETTGEMLRFSGRDDHAPFLGMLAKFVETVQTFSLELSPDISETRRLPELLGQLAGQETR